jgi:hypothetical protein
MTRLNRSTLTLAALTFIAAAALKAQQSPDLAPYLIADRNAEIALARTAAPKEISDSATVLIMTRQGLIEAVHGGNGFTCFVLRSFSAGLKDPGFWNPQVRAPQCINAPAVKTMLPEIRKRVEWILAGVTLTEIAARTARGYASREFPLPATGAMAYMLSHEQHLADADPHWMPHLMFYYDATVAPSTFGAGGMSAPVINGSAGDPHSPVLTLFIPVPQWSDGTPAMADAGH